MKESLDIPDILQALGKSQPGNGNEHQQHHSGHYIRQMLRKVGRERVGREDAWVSSGLVVSIGFWTNSCYGKSVFNRKQRKAVPLNTPFFVPFGSQDLCASIRNMIKYIY